MKPIAALRKFFGDEENPVSVKEIKALSKEERNELGKLACEEMGETFEPS